MLKQTVMFTYIILSKRSAVNDNNANDSSKKKVIKHLLNKTLFLTNTK